MLHSHEGGGNGAFLDLCFVGFVFLFILAGVWRFNCFWGPFVYTGLNALA